MSLPLLPPLEPMLAKAQSTIPAGMAYEPKWDGFRCLVFRDGDAVILMSRNGRELTGYFPEVVTAIRAETPAICVLDGELVVRAGDRLDFERLSERIHPAPTRVATLAVATPAELICWDLLALGEEVLTEQPFSLRRQRLVEALAGAGRSVHLTPLTESLDQAKQWFSRFEGAGLDGIVAKPWAGTYQPGKRSMIKVKHSREADVVVAGYRLHRNSTVQRPLLGSLQLGLFEGEVLHFVGVAAAFSESVRAELASSLAASALPADTLDHPWAPGEVSARRPGAVSRWRSEPRQTTLIDPMLVCTVTYEHMQGMRFRHSAQFQRWRPDRDPASCTFEQLIQVPGFALEEVLASGG